MQGCRQGFARRFAPGAVALGLGAALVAGCSGGHKSQPPVTPPPPAPQGQAPQPPMGASAGMIVPPLGADGRRVTPNRDLSSAETLWHVRMALNVAALACEAHGGAARISYNALLKTHKAALARTNSTVDAEYKARYGTQGLAMRDTMDTRVYNFFALPPVQDQFCARAADVARTFNGKASAELAGYAPTALAALEEPYLVFYDAYAAYQERLRAWRAADGGAQTLSAR